MFGNEVALWSGLSFQGDPEPLNPQLYCYLQDFRSSLCSRHYLVSQDISYVILRNWLMHIDQ